MTIIQAAILAVVQGVSEFLPISSSGHLAILSRQLRIADPPSEFVVLVHVGTLLATLLYFRGSYLKIIRSGDRAVAFRIVIGTIPAAVLGIFLAPLLDTLFQSRMLVTVGFLVTSILLFASRNTTQKNKTISELNLTDALRIGIFQAGALMPGWSRAGSTIFASQRQGLDNENAFLFSFLLYIPVSLGAAFLTLISSQTNYVTTPLILVGLIVPTVVGYLSLEILGQVLKQEKLYLFFPYTLALAVLNWVL